MTRVVYTPNYDSTPTMSRAPSPIDTRVPCTLNTNLLHCPCCQKARQETEAVRTDLERIQSKAIQDSRARDNLAHRDSKKVEFRPRIALILIAAVVPYVRFYEFGPNDNLVFHALMVSLLLAAMAAYLVVELLSYTVQKLQRGPLVLEFMKS